MGYRVRKSKNGENWKLAYETFVGGRKLTYIPLCDWAGLGLYPLMGIDNARSRVKVINSLESIKRVTEARITISGRYNEERIKFESVFPRELLKEFEQQLALLKIQKWQSTWRAAQRTLSSCELPRSVSDWAAYANSFYEYFENQKWSASHVAKVLYLINKWGKFYARRLCIFFEPVPMPRGRSLQQIADANFDAKETKTSSILTPTMLEAQRNNLSQEHFNWLYLSLWYGLRPGEVDLLRLPSGPRTWAVDQWKGYKVLTIYQPKLVTIERSRRYKRIPCVRTEQEIGLKIIQSKQFVTPLTKTLRTYFSPGIKRYGGRKGFVSLMLGYGYTLEKISRWMGHQSIERTWRSYTNKMEDLV